MPYRDLMTTSLSSSGACKYQAASAHSCFVWPPQLPSPYYTHTTLQRPNRMCIRIHPDFIKILRRSQQDDFRPKPIKRILLSASNILTTSRTVRYHKERCSSEALKIVGVAHRIWEHTCSIHPYYDDASLHYLVKDLRRCCDEVEAALREINECDDYIWHHISSPLKSRLEKASASMNNTYRQFSALVEKVLKEAHIYTRTHTHTGDNNNNDDGTSTIRHPAQNTTRICWAEVQLIESILPFKKLDEQQTSSSEFWANTSYAYHHPKRVEDGPSRLVLTKKFQRHLELLRLTRHQDHIIKLYGSSSTFSASPLIALVPGHITPWDVYLHRQIRSVNVGEDQSCVVGLLRGLMQALTYIAGLRVVTNWDQTCHLLMERNLMVDKDGRAIMGLDDAPSSHDLMAPPYRPEHGFGYTMADRWNHLGLTNFQSLRGLYHQLIPCIADSIIASYGSSHSQEELPFELPIILEERSLHLSTFGGSMSSQALGDLGYLTPPSSRSSVEGRFIWIDNVLDCLSQPLYWARWYHWETGYELTNEIPWKFLDNGLIRYDFPDDRQGRFVLHFITYTPHQDAWRYLRHNALRVSAERNLKASDLLLVGSSSRVFHILVEGGLRYVFVHTEESEVKRCYLLEDAFPLEPDELVEEISYFTRKDALFSRATFFAQLDNHDVDMLHQTNPIHLRFPFTYKPISTLGVPHVRSSRALYDRTRLLHSKVRRKILSLRIFPSIAQKLLSRQIAQHHVASH